MMEKRCGNCKWIRETGVSTKHICSKPVPLWVINSSMLELRVVNSISMDCPTYEAKS